eukprot:TRINITY_DN824_c6_g1_i1.p1 TRINITY_DN824_c6_g1~~TRINITY_DN824_c6_g1_i1.p1  ORF type:complete len:1295 (+),score=149.23 TRINITY_DN824_c6_g1_i1:304-3885(+)
MLWKAGYNTWRANRVWRGGECSTETVCTNGVFDYLQYLVNDFRPQAEMIVFLSDDVTPETIESMERAIERSRKSQQYETLDTQWAPAIFKKISANVPEEYNSNMAPHSISFCLWHCRHPRLMDTSLPVVDTSLSSSFVVPESILSRYEVTQNLKRIKKLNRGSSIEVGFLRWSWRFFFNGKQVADPFPRAAHNRTRLTADITSLLDEYNEPEHFIIYTSVLPNSNFAHSTPAIATGRIGQWPTITAVLTEVAKLLRDGKYGNLKSIVIMTRNEVNNRDLNQQIQDAIDCAVGTNRFTPISRTWSFGEWSSKISSPQDAERWNIALGDYYELRGKTMGYLSGSVIPTRLLSQKVEMLERYAEAIRLWGTRFESSTLHMVFDESPDIELRTACDSSYTTTADNVVLQTLVEGATLPWHRQLTHEKVDDIKWIFKSGLMELSQSGKLFNVTSNPFGMWTTGNYNSETLIVLNRGPPHDISSIRSLLLNGYNIWVTKHPQRSTNTELPHGHLLYLSDSERPVSDYIVFIQGGMDDTYYQPSEMSLKDSVKEAIDCIKTTRRYTPLARLWFPSTWSVSTKDTASVWNEVVSLKDDVNIKIKPMQLAEPVMSYDTGGQFAVTREMVLERGRQTLWLRLLRDVTDAHRAVLFPYSWHFIFRENQTTIPNSDRCTSVLTNIGPSPNLDYECRPLTGKVRYNSHGCWSENSGSKWQRNILVVTTGDAAFRESGIREIQKHGYNVWIPTSYGNCSKFGTDTYGYSCREGFGVLSYLADPNRPVADYIVFSHSHINSWHQEGSIVEAIKQALPIISKTHRGISLNAKYFPEEWNIRTNNIPAQYNSAISGTGARPMNLSRPLLFHCCTQIIVPSEQLHRNMNPKAAVKLLELSQRNKTYSGWWFEYVFHFVIGEEENNELFIHPSHHLLPTEPTNFVSNSATDFGHLEADCLTLTKFGILLHNSKVTGTGLLPLVVIGDAYTKGGGLDNFINSFLRLGHRVFVSRELCPSEAAEVCTSSWGYVSFFAGRDRPPTGDYVLFVNSHISSDSTVQNRIAKAHSMLSVIQTTDCNATAIPLFPERPITVEEGGLMAEQIASTWNAHFGDLQAKMTSKRSFAIYPAQFLLASSTLDTNHETYTVFIRIWRELQKPSSTVTENLQYYWLFLFIRRQQMGLPLDSHLVWPNEEWAMLLRNEGCLNSYRLYE